MDSVTIHRVTQVRVKETKESDVHGKPFFSRTLIVRNEDGKETEISLFSEEKSFLDIVRK